MSKWLSGSALSAEASRHVGQFLSLYRVRPRDEDEYVRPDEDVSDQELVLTHGDLEEALTNNTLGGSRLGRCGTTNFCR